MCCLAKAVRPLTDRAEAVYALLAAYAQRAASAGDAQPARRQERR
jgi:hypothetical protein